MGRATAITARSPVSERVLITGASGFVGGHLAREWVDNGAEVLGISRRGTITEGSGLSVDLLNIDATRDAVAQFKPTVVHHLAALASTGRSWDEPARCVADNQATTWSILEAVREEAPSASVVLACSGESYGSPLSLPVDESHLLAPTTPYAVAKTVADLIGGLYAQAHGLHVIRARAFNHAGPGQSDSFLIGSLCAQAKAQADQATVTLQTGAAATRRDYTDVRDVVRAYRLLAVAGQPGAYNVCSGVSTSTAEIVEMIGKIAGVTVVHEAPQELARPHETLDIFGDPTKLTAATGWQPQIPLSQTITDTLTSV